MEIERTLIDLQSSPWTFLVLGILTVLASIPFIWKIVTTIYKILSDVSTNGILSLKGWLRAQMYQAIMKLCTSKNPSANFAIIVLQSISLLASSFFYLFMLLYVLTVNNFRSILYVIEIFFAVQTETKLYSWAILAFSGAALLNLLVAAIYIGFNIVAIQTYIKVISKSPDQSK